MAELVRVDRALVQALNHEAQPQPLRLVLLVATVLAAAPALLLAVLAVQALRRRDPASLAVVALTAVGGAAALGLNQLAGHLYSASAPTGRSRQCMPSAAGPGTAPSSPTTPPSPPRPRHGGLDD